MSLTWESSLWQDPKHNVFEERLMPLPNILSSSWSLEDVFELWEWSDRLHPLAFDYTGNSLTIQNTRYLYHNDPHYNEITSYFDRLKESPFYHDRYTQHKRSPLWYSHVLNLPNTPEDVRLRQEWVKELVENNDLFLAIEELFSKLEAYSTDEWHWWESNYDAILNPIEAKKLLQKLLNLSSHNPTNQAFHNIIEWCREISEDSYFQHILKQKYRIDDYHVLSFYSQRYEQRVWATLKNGVKIEDFCDIIPASWESYTEWAWKWRNAKLVTRHVINEENPWDKDKDQIPHARSRQRVDHIKKLASASLSIPLFLLLTQLKHLYLWALMYKDFEKRGFPVCFPEVSDDEFDLSFTDLYPAGWVFKWKIVEELMPNTLAFEPDEKVIYVKWANSCWKSELFRSIHFVNMLINAWYPVPAKFLRSWVIPSSKFILFQWSRHSWSQLENAKHHVFQELEDVLPGSNVILDEVWDATNEPTAAKMWEIFIKALLDNWCRIFITSHHDALDPTVKKEWWVSLSPKQWAEWIERYKVIRSDWEVDYNAEETLNRLWITRTTVEEILWTEKRTSAKRKKPTDRNIHEFRDGDDEIPF
jgi:hypothetical protein